MPNVSVYKTDGKKAGEITLSDKVFGAKINKAVMHDVVVAHLANKRQGTQSALTRAEVRGGGIKPFRQKGTGHARQGSARSPINEGGGVIFAPKPRSYAKKINRKVRQLALFSAMSSKVADEDIIVLEDLALDAPKTKEMAKVLSNLKAGKALIVTDEADEGVIRAAANIQGVKTTLATTLSVYDILKYDKFIITKDAARKIEEVYAS
jgi:large subunit ribosomal protein L4